MSHPLVLALFDRTDRAQAATSALHANGLPDARLSIVAATHEEEGELARDLGGTPGVDIEDSRTAARLGELGARILAAVAVVMPGIGPIVGAGPLSAGLGEAAGHMGGGMVMMLRGTGIPEAQAERWQVEIERGGVLLGIHLEREDPSAIEALMKEHGALDVALATWPHAGM
jgi:hypothetical protein